MKSISINDLVQPKETLTQEKMTSISGGWSTIFDVFDLINARLEEARLKRKIDAYQTVDARISYTIFPKKMKEISFNLIDLKNNFTTTSN